MSGALTQQELRGLLDYDPETGWFRWRGSGRWVNSYSNGYIYVRIDDKKYYAHRLAWFYVHGQWPEYQIDHINLVKHDNRLCNLRQATHPQNTKNKPRPRSNTSGAKGVTRKVNGKGERFIAAIMVDGRSRHLGTFDTLEGAREAYCSAATISFGEFCPLTDAQKCDKEQNPETCP